MTNQNEPDSIAGPAQLLVQEVWNRGDLALVDELVTDDYVEFDPIRSDPVRGPEALKERVAQYRQGMPDLTRTIDETFVDGTTVVIPYTAAGTHDGEFLGVAPTGRQVEVQGILITRVETGELAEGTDLWNAFGLLGQIGALPESLAD